MQQITPCLWFDGTAEQAANFYCSVFKSATIKNVSRYSDAGPGEPGSILVVEIDLNGTTFALLNGGPMYLFSSATSFMISCTDQDEVDHYWEKLSDGGIPNRCGWVTDKFGVTWQVIPQGLDQLLGGGGDPKRAARVTQSLHTMTKLDIAVLRSAYHAD